MRLNNLKPTPGSKQSAKRRGRGIGSTLGKTCGRGHKGQKSRSGGFHKVGFEGGQMPLQRRIPKFGFNSRRAKVTAEIRLHELNKLDAAVDMESLRAHNLIHSGIQYVKIIVSGKLTKALTVRGVRVSKGARAAIEAAGGKIEE